MKYSRLLLGIAVAMGVGLTGTRASADQSAFKTYDLTYVVTKSVKDAGSQSWRDLPKENNIISVTLPKGSKTYNLRAIFPNYYNSPVDTSDTTMIVKVPEDEKDSLSVNMKLFAEKETPKLRYVLENPDATKSTKQFTDYQYVTGTIDGNCRPILAEPLKADYSLAADKETVITRNMAPLETTIHRQKINYQITYETVDGEKVAHEGLDTDSTATYNQVTEKLNQLSDQVKTAGYQIQSRKVSYDEAGNGSIQFEVKKNPDKQPEKPNPQPGQSDLGSKPKPQPEPETKPEPEPNPKPIPTPTPQPLPMGNSNNGSNPIPNPDTNGNTNQLDNNAALTQSPEFKKLLDRFNQLLQRYTRLLEKQPTSQHKKTKHKHAHTKHKKRQIKQRKQHSKISKIKKQGQRLKHRQAKRHQSKHHSKNNHHLHHKKHA
ncbi:hypothetical protein ACFP1H_07520 [Secundilactobacillus hailunensis]|uniref:Uncharacterized protein n=1 Tax=Secundilactobacillus hailunensis TaxID=2559923 RepID=A0ABW1T9H8_9LACO|nr:hypothetical protein [Secundilactobacillus hailunensis]